MERAERGVVAINETYRTRRLGTMGKQHVEAVLATDVVLETQRGEAFTEGEWRGRDGGGAVGFVANQMEVLEGMWLARLDERYKSTLMRTASSLLITFGGKARHTSMPVKLHPAHLFRLDEEEDDPAMADLNKTRRTGLRSRRASGVGNVAGERGDRSEPVSMRGTAGDMDSLR